MTKESGNGQESFGSGRKSPWRKLLWVKQPYPDNYVDSSFLSQLKRNSNVRPYNFLALAKDSSVILINLCSVVIFGLVFLGIYNNDWDPIGIAIASTSISVAGYVAREVHANRLRIQSTTVKSALLILFVILALSPVLKSLTQSTSSDSIWSLAIWLCIANILFNDYSFFSKKRFKLVISTNLALSAAIVLASRLPTTSSVFCFVLFSVQLFGLLPLFATWVRETSPQGHWALLGTLLSITDVSLFVFYGPSAMGVWIVVQLSVALAFPGWFLGLQKYKNEIQGPWDPARPVIGPH